MKRALVYGANSEKATELIKFLKKNNSYWVRAVDKDMTSSEIADDFVMADLTEASSVMTTMFSDVQPFDEVYQFTQTEDNSADDFVTSSLVNIYTLRYAKRFCVGKVFCLSNGSKHIEKLYSLSKKDKDINVTLIKTTGKTTSEDIIKLVKKENKKALKKLGKIKK